MQIHRYVSKYSFLLLLLLVVFGGCQSDGCKGCSRGSSSSHVTLPPVATSSVFDAYAPYIPTNLDAAFFVDGNAKWSDYAGDSLDQMEGTSRGFGSIQSILDLAPGNSSKFVRRFGLMNDAFKVSLQNPGALDKAGVDIKKGVVVERVADTYVVLFHVKNKADIEKNFVSQWVKPFRDKGPAPTLSAQEIPVGDGKANISLAEFAGFLRVGTIAWYIQDDFVIWVYADDKDKIIPVFNRLLDPSNPKVLNDSVGAFTKEIASNYQSSLYFNPYLLATSVLSKKAADGESLEKFGFMLKDFLYVGTGSKEEKRGDKNISSVSMYAKLKKDVPDNVVNGWVKGSTSLSMAPYVQETPMVSLRFALSPEYLSERLFKVKDVSSEMGQLEKTLGVDVKKDLIETFNGEVAIFVYGLKSGNPMAILDAIRSAKQLSESVKIAIVQGFKDEESFNRFIALAKKVVEADNLSIKSHLEELPAVDGVREFAISDLPVRIFFYKNQLLITSYGLSKEDAIARITGKVTSSEVAPTEMQKRFFADEPVNGLYFNLVKIRTDLGFLFTMTGLNTKKTPWLQEYNEVLSTVAPQGHSIVFQTEMERNDVKKDEKK